MLEDSPEAGVTFFWCSYLFWVEATSSSLGGWIRCIHFILKYFYNFGENFLCKQFNNNLCPFRAQKGILYFFVFCLCLLYFLSKIQLLLSHISCMLAATLEKLLACRPLSSYYAQMISYTGNTLIASLSFILLYTFRCQAIC